ncbi:hypothetical protein LDENG_00234660 [Lucifuga dentata]|nr:hypothetical protein LDENG_00234660 [Lucifuga dentata]
MDSADSRAHSEHTGEESFYNNKDKSSPAALSPALTGSVQRSPGETALSQVSPVGRPPSGSPAPTSSDSSSEEKEEEEEDEDEGAGRRMRSSVAQIRRSRDGSNEQDGSRSREQSKGKDRPRSRSRSKGRDRSISKERDGSRSRSRSKGRDRSREQDRSRSRSMSKGRDRSRSRSRERGRSRPQETNRSRGQDRCRSREREKDRPRSRERDWEHYSRGRHAREHHDDRDTRYNRRPNQESEARRRARASSSPAHTEPAADQPPVKKKKEELDPILTRTGGAYIPPAKLRMMQQQITDKSSLAYQRMSWEALKKSINGLINKVNVSNIVNIIQELLQENIVRGRGLLARSILQAQAASPIFTHVYAAVVAIINSKFPQIGELILKRLILSFRRGYRRNLKQQCLTASKFVAHLINQNVVRFHTHTQP